MLLGVLLQMRSEPDRSNAVQVSPVKMTGKRTGRDLQPAALLAPPSLRHLLPRRVLRNLVMLAVLLKLELGRESTGTLEATTAPARMGRVLVREEVGPQTEPVSIEEEMGKRRSVTWNASRFEQE